MLGEITHFRKRFIGGFNRDDVVAYISRISDERNESIEAKEQCEAELEKLGEQISESNKKREEAEREVEKLRLLVGELQTRKEMAENEANRMRSELSELRGQKGWGHHSPEPKPVYQGNKERKPLSNALKVRLNKKRRD